MKNMFSALIFLALTPAALLAATISGTVTTGTAPSTPVAGAMVVLLQQGAGGPVPVDTAFTDSLGQYTFTNVTIGAKIVSVSATGYTSATQIANITNPNQSVTLNFNLARTGSGATGSISGTVTAGGNPVSGALVTVSLIGPGGLVVVDSARTDSLGRYMLDSVTAQSGYIISVTAPGYTTTFRSNVTVTANVNTQQNFTITPVPIIQGSILSSNFRLLETGGRLILDLGSMKANSVEVYGPSGALRHRVSIPKGASHVVLPPEITAAQANLLRVR